VLFYILKTTPPGQVENYYLILVTIYSIPVTVGKPVKDAKGMMLMT